MIVKAIPFLFLLTSCASWHCKRCFESGRLKSDTVHQTITVELPKVDIDTVLLVGPSLEGVSDTIVLHRDKLTIRFRDLPGDTVYLSGTCEPDTIKVTVTKLIENEVKTGYTMAHLIGVGLAVLLIMGLALFIVSKAR